MEGVIISKKFVPAYYLTTKEKRRTSKPEMPAGVYMLSDSMQIYHRNQQKIKMLLLLSDHIPDIKFSQKEKASFAEAGRIYYRHLDLKRYDMNLFGKNILLEQAIVTIISNLETYYSSIFRKIMDDWRFLEKMVSNSKNIDQFLRKTGLANELHLEFFLNGQKYNGMKFGSYVLDKGSKRRVSFQRKESIQKFLNIFPDVKRQIPNGFWAEFTLFAKERHNIVHKLIVSDSTLCNSSRIENAITIFNLTIETIDKGLFEAFPIEVLG